MKNHLKVGAIVPAGVEYLRTFHKLKLGNFILTKLPLDKQEALEIVSFCRENKIFFIFSEFLFRGTLNLYFSIRKRIKREEFYSKEDLEEIFRTGGEYFLGRITLGEAGGMLYWPKEYLYKRGAGSSYRNLPDVKNIADAKRVYIEFLKKVIGFERKLGESKLLDVDSSMVFKYHLEAGIDIPLLEVMPGDCNIMYAAIRGASRAYNRWQWGAHIAIGWYGGEKIDTLWFKRWKTSLYSSFLAGADFIYPESGLFSHGSYGFHSLKMSKSRAILREFNQFCRIHYRPNNKPKVKIGFVHGNLDGTPGLWNKYVWGQFKGRKWLHGPAEDGWNYLTSVYRKEEWFNSHIQGELDFSGNLPHGQYDIVPIESPVSVLKSYICLIFLGWNTMTDEIYQKLKTYVSQGGHLFMAVPHLNTCVDRDKEMNLYRRGDYRDLFGVIVRGKGRRSVSGVQYINDSSIRSYKFTKQRTDPEFIGEIMLANVEVTSAKILAGRQTSYKLTIEEPSKNPILVENSYGRGKAFLITTWSYPGDKGMDLFMRDLLRTIYLGEQGDIRVIGSDKIRYSIYDDTLPNDAGQKSRFSIIYLLNTDFDCTHLMDLWVKGKVIRSIAVPATEMRVIYYHQGIAIITENRFVDLNTWRINKNHHHIEFFNLREQKLDIYNFHNCEQKVEINRKRIICSPDNIYSLTLKKEIDPLRKLVFDMNFLSEPKIKWRRGDFPY